MLTVFSNNKEIPTNRVEFSDGCINYKINTLPKNPTYISVNVSPVMRGNQVMEELDLITGAILGNEDVDFSETKFILNIPYLYNARADRRFDKGNAEPLINFLLNIRDRLVVYDMVYCCDIHNKKPTESITGLKVKEKTQLQCFKDSIGHNFNTDYDIIIAPDKGAIDKARTIAEHLEVDICYAGKRRDISTGRIVETILPDIDFTGCKVLIPDDILDGGYTFIKLAEKLKEAGAAQVDLYVTHLIAAKGLDILKPVVDNLFCYQTVGKFVNKQDVLNFNLGK